MAENVFLDSYLRDEIFSNFDFTMFSLVELEGYKKWSVWEKEQFEGFQFNKETKLMERTTAPALKWSEIKNLLLSKEWTQEQHDELEAKLKQYGPLELTGDERVEKVAFSSFLRSGNTLSRKYFETITGISTGSVMHNRRIGNFALFKPGFKHEGIFDDRVHIIKTHLPFTANFTQKIEKMPCTKAIICLRNPLDVCPSLLQLRMTYTHNFTS